MRERTAMLLGTILLVAGTAHAMGPANVFRSEGTCSVGWFGCSIDDATMQGDGTWVCDGDAIGSISIAGDNHGVDANNGRGNTMLTCRTQIAFEQPNPGGLLGDFEEVVAVPTDFICALLPAACQGNGALIGNPRTIGELAVCTVFGTPTTRMQTTVAPNGNTSLKCHLPDPANLPEGAEVEMNE